MATGSVGAPRRENRSPNIPWDIAVLLPRCVQSAALRVALSRVFAGECSTRECSFLFEAELFQFGLALGRHWSCAFGPAGRQLSAMGWLEQKRIGWLED